MFDFIATKYYSEKYGLLELRYKIHVYITEDSGFIEYTASNGRKCKMHFFENNNGYLWTSLAIKGGGKVSGRINRLVYSNVYGEIPKGYQVDHIDRNRKNNMPDNLRIATKCENNRNKDIKGSNNPFSKLTEKEAREILVLCFEGKMTRKEIADKYNTTVASVKSIRAGRNWKFCTKDIFEKYSKGKKEV